MNTQDFKNFQIEHAALKASWSGAFLSLAFRMSSTLLGLYLSSSPTGLIWVLGQLILGFSMFHWFSVLHDSGHDAFFPAQSRFSRFLHAMAGLTASIVSFVPYYSWKFVHLEHHKWTGHLDQDPSTRDLLKVTPLKRTLARWAWKSYVPAFAFAFLLGTFWNFPKLFKIFPKWGVRIRIIVNLILIVFVHILYQHYVGHWVRDFALAFIFFGIICEPIIISQHAHIPMKRNQLNPQPFALNEQDVYTRAIVFPTWVSKYLTLSFENHIAHHFAPWIPSYILYKVQTQTGNEVPAFQWIWEARQVPGDVLMFQDRDETGLKI